MSLVEGRTVTRIRVVKGWSVVCNNSCDRDIGLPVMSSRLGKFDKICCIFEIAFLGLPIKEFGLFLSFL